jgi:hypothetical protein
VACSTAIVSGWSATRKEVSSEGAGVNEGSTWPVVDAYMRYAVAAVRVPILSHAPLARRGWTPRMRFRYQRIMLRIGTARQLNLPTPSGDRRPGCWSKRISRQLSVFPKRYGVFRDLCKRYSTRWRDTSNYSAPDCSSRRTLECSTKGPLGPSIRTSKGNGPLENARRCSSAAVRLCENNVL